MNFISLLKLEWFKYSKNRLFKFAIILLLLLPPGLLFMVSTFKNSPPLPSGSFYVSFPQVWDWAAYMVNWSSFFMIGFISIYIISYEREHRLMKQSIINGLSRLDYFMSKVVFIGMIILAYTLYYILVSLIFGEIYTTTDVEFSFDWKRILGVFIMIWVYASLGILFAMLFKRVGIAAILFIIYGMFFENIIRYVVHNNIVKGISMHFYPINAAEDLAPLPIPPEVNTMMEQSSEVGIQMFLTFNQAAITSSVYIVIFLGLSLWLMVRRDL